MSYFSINGLIAFFDLRNILCDSSQKRHKIMFECTLHYGIKISFFNNFYYFLDFSDCELGYMCPILNLNELNDFEKAEKSIAISLQKEVINAINALIYNEQRKAQQNVTYSNHLKRAEITNDIDQFMIPNTVDKILMPFDDYINSGASFSSKAYEIACESMSQKEPCCISDLKFAKQAIKNFDSILQIKDENCQYNLQPFYILSNLWKSIYYINHDLRIDASIQLRSVFESLVRSKFNLKNQEEIKPIQYEQYCITPELNEFFINSRATRAGSVHKLLITNDTKNLRQYAKHLIDFFERDFEINIGGIIR
ncbi:hypothetical protein [Facilibium subflavum]|uniref:hypothetical protein n=1 Tax=Facilibium subflavum TaxID=2219058 RepID=UPI000E65A816|nr:hypothetical protein [Facilibium subflavum]